jgi:phosphopantetheinyl transferase
VFRGDDDTVRVVRVHCCAVPASLSNRKIAGWIRALPEPRRSLLAERLSNGTGHESLTVLALLADLLRVLRLPSIGSLEWTPQGKPRLTGGPAISLTHSRGFAACAIAPGGLEIGIDLEPEGRASAPAVALVASDAEREALAGGLLSPTGLWTAKEAVLKAAGAGLSEISGVAVDVRCARFAGAQYRWRHFRPRPGLLLAVASRGLLPAVRIHWPSPASVFE